MLGVKSNRGVIKGVFADKLREQISAARPQTQTGKEQLQSKSAKEIVK